MPLRGVFETIANAGSKFDELGYFGDEKRKELIRLLLRGLVEWTCVGRSFAGLEPSCSYNAATKK
jgi:hypothetical protein